MEISRFNFLPADVLSNLIRISKYEDLLSLYKQSDEKGKRNIILALSVKDTAENIAINTLGFDLEDREYNNAIVDWARTITHGLKNNIANLVYVTYEAGFLDFFRWYTSQIMSEDKKIELVNFLLNIHNYDAIRAGLLKIRFKLINKLYLLGRYEQILEVVESPVGFYRGEFGKGNDFDDIDLVGKLLSSSNISFKRRFLRALMRKGVIKFIDLAGRNFTKGGKYSSVDDNTKDVYFFDERVRINDKGILDILYPITFAKSRTPAEVLNYVQNTEMPLDEAIIVFRENEEGIKALVENYPQIIEDKNLLELLRKNFPNQAWIKDRIYDNYLKTKQKSNRSFRFNLPLLKEAIKNNDYTTFIEKWDDEYEIQELEDAFLNIRSAELLQFFARKRFNFSKLNMDKLVEMILTLPEDVSFFKIFNNDLAEQMFILTRYGNLFTTEDLIRAGFSWKALLSYAGIDTSTPEEVLEELIYKDVPDNIREAIEFLAYERM